MLPNQGPTEVSTYSAFMSRTLRILECHSDRSASGVRNLRPAIGAGLPRWPGVCAEVLDSSSLHSSESIWPCEGHLSPNPPKDTDGRREDSGRGVRELQGRWPGLHWGRWEVGGRSSVAAQGPYGRLRELRCAGWRENTQQGTLADRGGASLRGRWVSCSLAVRPGVEWLAAGPRRE